MPGVLLNPIQIDSKSGVLTLFGPNNRLDTRSATFDVGDKPYTVVAYNLAPGQTATLFNVTQIGPTVRESIFSYGGNLVRLTPEQPTGLVALTGTYRLVLNSAALDCVVKAYPQEAKPYPVAPVKSDLVNSQTLKANIPSPIIQIQDKVQTLTAYGLLSGEQVTVYFTSNGFDAYYATLDKDNTTVSLEFTGDYRAVSNVDCLITVRPNYVNFENPYRTKGQKGDTGGIGPAGGTTPILANVINDDTVDLPIGTPVSLSGAGRVVRANKDITARNAIGLVSDILLPVGGSGFVQTEGEMELTIVQWNGVLETLGGLVPAKNYYISGLGELSHTPPAQIDGTYSCVIGKSVTPTTIIIEPQVAYLL